MSKKSVLKIESTTTDVRPMAQRNRFKERNKCKKDKSTKLIPVAWHPTRWSHWCVPKDEEKEINLSFIDKNQYKVGR